MTTHVVQCSGRMDQNVFPIIFAEIADGERIVMFNHDIQFDGLMTDQIRQSRPFQGGTYVERLVEHLLRDEPHDLVLYHELQHEEIKFLAPLYRAGFRIREMKAGHQRFGKANRPLYAPALREVRRG